METVIFWLVAINLLLLILLIRFNKRLEKEKYHTAVATKAYEQEHQIAEQLKEIIRELDATKNATKYIPAYIPAGTIEAVKEAMKRSHPDNGGNAEDFQMYRRAYNVLIGKEKL